MRRTIARLGCHQRVREKCTTVDRGGLPVRSAESIAKEFARAWSLPRGGAWSVDDIHDAIRQAQVEAIAEAIAIVERHATLEVAAIVDELRALSPAGRGSS
jgi:hypothetical protein